MTSPSKSNSGDTSENTTPTDVTLESEQVSGALLEQVNHRTLKSMHSLIISISDKLSVQESSEGVVAKKDGSMRIDLPVVVGILSILATLVGGVTWINSTIDTKVRDSRQELKQDLQSLKQDLSAQDKDTQAALTRLSDRNDIQFDKINDKLDSIGQKIDSKSK